MYTVYAIRMFGAGEEATHKQKNERTNERFHEIVINLIFKTTKYMKRTEGMAERNDRPNDQTEQTKRTNDKKRSVYI